MASCSRLPISGPNITGMYLCPSCLVSVLRYAVYGCESWSFIYAVQALYLPWVLVGYDYLTTGVTPMASLAGMGAAHLYYYLTTVYPSQGGRRYLSTPSFLHRLFPSSRAGFTTGAGFQAYPGRTAQQQQQQQQQMFTNPFGGHSWGRGQRLGS